MLLALTTYILFGAGALFL